jgi:hypothetical protein
MRSEVEEHPPEDYLSDASHSGGLCSLRGACPHLESESPASRGADAQTLAPPTST